MSYGQYGSHCVLYYVFHCRFGFGLPRMVQVVTKPFATPQDLMDVCGTLCSRWELCCLLKL